MSATATREPEAAPQPRERRERAPRDFDRPRFLTAFTGLFYLVLFLPIAIVVLFSFNAERSVQRMAGLSLQWYETFFESASYTSSFVASLQVALVTTIVGTVLGTTLAFGLVRSRSGSAGRPTCSCSSRSSRRRSWRACRRCCSSPRWVCGCRSSP